MDMVFVRTSVKNSGGKKTYKSFYLGSIEKTKKKKKMVSEKVSGR